MREFRELKAIWVIDAGVIPNKPMKEYRKVWHYTVDDYEADKTIPTGRMNKYSTILKEVVDYLAEITDPGYVNWTRQEFIWY